MPVVAGEGIAFADVFVFVCMVAIAAILWSLVQVRSPISKVPVIGGPGVNLIDGLRSNIAQLAKTLEDWLTFQQNAASALFARWEQVVVTPYFNIVDKAITVLGTQLWAGLGAAIVNIGQQIAFEKDQVVRLLAPQIAAVGAEVVAIEQFDAQLLKVVIPQLQALEQQDAQAVGRALSDLANLGGRVLAIERSLAALIPFVPELARLAAFEAATVGGISALVSEEAIQLGRVKGLEIDFQKLAALTILGALTATAIDQLVRIAKDPCSICPGLDLSTVEARLSALEAFGEV